MHFVSSLVLLTEIIIQADLWPNMSGTRRLEQQDLPPSKRRCGTSCPDSFSVAELPRLLHSPKGSQKVKPPISANFSPTVESRAHICIKEQKRDQSYDEGMVPLCMKWNRQESELTKVCDNAMRHIQREQHYEALKALTLVTLRVHHGAEELTEENRFGLLHNLGVRHHLTFLDCHSQCIQYCHYKLGNIINALDCFTEALQGVPPHQLHHHRVATTHNCIGVLVFHDKTFSCVNALRAFQLSLSILEPNKNEHQVFYATVLNNIGRVLYLLENYDEALEAYQNALNIRREKLGASSIDLSATICNTGQTLHQLGKFDGALKLYEEFLALIKKQGPEEQRDVAIILRCVADIHHRKEDYESARDVYVKALEETKLSVGGLHPEVASTLNKLGSVCFEMKDCVAALEYYTQSLEQERMFLGKLHPQTLVTLLNIAHIYHQVGNFTDAYKRFKEVHASMVIMYGTDSLESASAMFNMGLMKYQLKQNDEALDYYQEALRIQRDFYGNDENQAVASSLNSIGLVLFNKGAHTLAKDCFYESLRIRKKLFGSDHREVAVLWYNLATFHLETGDAELGIRYYEETLRIEREVLGTEHPNVTLTLQHLGLACQQQGKLEKALVYFEEAHTLEKGKNEKNGEAISKLLNLMGNIHLQRGHTGKMMKCFTEASRSHGHNLLIAGYALYELSKLHPLSAAQA